MSNEPRRWYARSAHWLIRRNPTYLLSAAAMALGARWYLVEPDAPAGEIGLILMTLGFIQAYELAVTGVLILLHRRRKSPEDQPSLMLVAALFWTGPMAATVEMTARDGTAGMGFAVAACLIALVELQTVRRAIGLRLSPASQAAASLCVLLVAAAPAWLRVPYGTSETNEVALYLSWWVLGGLMLLAPAGLAWQRRRIRDRETTELMGDWRPGGDFDTVCHWQLAVSDNTGGQAASGTRESGTRESGARESGTRVVHAEAAFLGMVFVATGVHLWAMNYAFFCNARMFYATPALAALAVILFDYLAYLNWRVPILWVMAATPAGAAIVLAFEGFHEAVPVGDAPLPVRDPVLAALVCAAGAWWFGAIRSRSPLFLHVGAVSLVLAAFRGVSFPAPWVSGADAAQALMPASRDEAAILVYGVAAYLLATAWLRRSRVEILAAIVAQWGAFALLVWGRTSADAMCVCFVGGWSWLAALHVAWRQPTWRATVWPIAGLTIATAVFAFEPALLVYAACHGAGMVAFLIVLGWLWPWTMYRVMGALVGTIFAAGATAVGISRGSHPKAALAVLSAFLLLAVGVVVSWHKNRLLGADDAHPSEPRP